MPKKAIIYDLDNTIYAVSSIGDKLFGPLFNLIADSGKHTDSMDAIRYAIMRTPFRLVAQRHNFSEELKQKGIELQELMDYKEAISTFEDYPEIKNIPGERFLVTTGFKTMQESKIRQMGIASDFKEIHIVNPVESSKKQVFADILNRYNYKPDDVLVVGDDPESEIAAAKALGIPTVLYDKDNIMDASEADFKISNFTELIPIYLNS